MATKIHKVRYFENGLKVHELKKVTADWPEFDRAGNPCEVWAGNPDGTSSEVDEISPLNVGTVGYDLFLGVNMKKQAPSKQQMFSEWIREKQRWKAPLVLPPEERGARPDTWAIARAITWAVTVTVWNGLAAYEMLQLFATGDGKRIWGVAGCLFIAAFVGVMAAQKRK